MRFLQQAGRRLRYLLKTKTTGKHAVSALACLVVFIMTYSLILPAIAIDKGEAASEPGISVEETVKNDTETNGKDVSAAESSDSAGDTDASDPSESQTSKESKKSGSAGSVSGAINAESSGAVKDQTAGSTASGKSVSNAEKSRNEAVKTANDNGSSAENKNDNKNRTSSAGTGGSDTSGTAADQSSGKDRVINYEGKDYAVTVRYSDDAGVPEDAVLSVKEITAHKKGYTSYCSRALDTIRGDQKNDNLSLSYIRLFDIKIMSGEEEIDPAGGVSVTVNYHDAIDVDVSEDMQAVHFGQEGPEVLETETSGSDESVEKVTFDAESFSVYAIVYTVDFAYEVDGKEYQFSLPGGGFVSFTELVETLGLAGDTDADLNDAAQKFAEDIESMEFSSPELMWVGRTDVGTTVGALKDANGLECEYSAELTEEQIEEINSTVVGSGDWALISLQAFDTEETLTVTMKDGEVFTIRVTDGQIQKDYLSADGSTYHIEVTLDDREEISDEAELHVEELTESAENYENYLYASAESMMLESVDDIQFARFFDIKILVNGEVVEPVYPVQVKITYQDAIELDDNQAVNVVHFADSGMEVIQAVDLSEDGKELTYEQSGFSITATVVAANNLQDGHQYIIYTDNNNKYYAMSHYSDGRDKDIVYGAEINASTTTGSSVNIADFGSSIVWTAHKVTSGGNTYWTFSYEENGKTYYLRSYGGLMVGADSDINEDGYRESSRYQWSINDRRLRARYTNDNNRRLRYSNNAGGFRERDNSGSSQFYFADVRDYTQDISAAPTIHYVDESGNELAVVNGRNWTTDTTVSPAFLIYDIDGYDYVKTTLESINGTDIRPILRSRTGMWQYTTSVEDSTSIAWNNVPADAEDPDRPEDIYVVYKKAAEPVTGGTPKIKESGATEDPASPAIHKDSTPNGDGTNTISLGITADTSPLEVEKLADVIVIFDTSTSMRRHMGTSKTTYEANETPVSQYRDHDTRMWIAADAVKDLAETLIGEHTQFQDSAGNKLIRMSLISFNRNAALECDFTDDPSTFDDAVDDLTTEAGTNWEAALDMANHMSVDPERATFVIFVTDGNPSYRTSRGNLLTLNGYPDMINDDNLDVNNASNYYFYRVLKYFGALDEDDPRNYNTAVVEAQSITAHNKNLYCIGIGNASGITRLQGLTTAAYNDNSTIGAQRTKTAENPTELSQAFSDITASIVALLGWGDITMTDGITALSNTVAKANLVNVDGDFEYWKAPAPAGWAGWSKDVRAAYIKGTSHAELTYPNGYDNWPDEEKTLYVNAYNAGKNLSDSSFASWDPASENCKEAEYDADRGSVIWDMGPRFVPDAGCTYRVTFKVWPSQEAYDILAKCRNDASYFDTLTAAEKAQITRTGTGPENYVYTLKTNDKEPNTTYKAARKTGDGVVTSGEEQTLLFNDVIPLGLASDSIGVKKVWQNALDDRPSSPVKLGVQAAGMDDPDTQEDEGLFATIDVSETNRWSGSASISPGLMKVENGVQTIYEHGHDFTITENVTDGPSYHWELTADTYRPMVITDAAKGYANPTTVMLKKVTVADSYDYVIDGGYYKIETGTATLTATNTRRSNLNLRKQVVDSAGKVVTSAQLFEFTITVDDPTIAESSGSDIWFSVQTDPDDTSTILKDLETSATPENENGSHTGFFYVGDNTSFTVKLQPGWNLRFTNLPTGTTYTITETAADGYSFNGAAVDNSGTFAITEGTTGSGVINKPNTQYTVTYTNMTITHNVSIWKTDIEHNTIVTGASFDLYSAADYDDAAGKPKKGAVPAVSGTTGKNGILTLGALAMGEYRLVETQAPAGYDPADSAIKIYVRSEEVEAVQGTQPAEVARNREDNQYRQYWVSGQEDGTWQIRVWNNFGVELPAAGGPGTTLIYLLGSMLLMVAGAGFIIRSRKKCTVRQLR